MHDLRMAQAADQGMVAHWQAEAHVAAWWGTVPDLSDQGADPHVTRLIATFANEPFAYVQHYDPRAWPAHHFAALPEGARGIDLFIGPPAMIGQGHGAALVGVVLRTLFRAGAPIVAVDPHPANARAIATYRRAGFGVMGPAIETAWGPALPMTVDRTAFSRAEVR